MVVGGGWLFKKGCGHVVDWLSVSQLSKMLEIPETTIRRYINNFEEYFRLEKVGRGRKYHPSSIEILQRIAALYNADRETVEIRKILADEFAFEVENNENNATIQPPAYDVIGQVKEFQQRQEEFNKNLLQQLNEQQKYIQELVMSRDDTFQEIKQLTSFEEKRRERFEQILLEHKIKRKLEKEAISLWDEKPEEERMVKVGWFRKEEDKDKRDRFIKDYIDENFEEYLRKEFDIWEEMK